MKDQIVATAPWLGELPSHWLVHTTKRHFVRRKEVNAGMKCDNRLALTMAGVIPRDIDDVDGLQSNDYAGYQIVEEGDIVFKLIDLQNIKTSRVGLVSERGIMSPAYVRLTRITDLDVRFAYWYFMALYWRQVFNGLGGGVRQTIGAEELLALPLPVPPRHEQTTIAAFLDRETAKIDALVEEQKRLIELLKEKRQAVISHAVTKGLNPNVRMKPSGVEWLGDVPEHWEVLPLKRCLERADYGISESLSSEGAIAVLRMGNLQDGLIDYSDLKFVDTVEDALLLRPNDLLYNRTNSLDLIGKVGMFEGRKEPITFASYLVRLRMKERCHPRFFAFLLNTEGLLGTARSRAFVAIGQCNLNPTRYAEINIACPPLDEQREIANYLRSVQEEVASLVRESDRVIKVLQERRSALISAAVTGKIDVRNFAAQEEAA